MKLEMQAANILVLDDDTFTLKMIERALRELGQTQVTTVSAAQQALALLARPGCAINLVFCDLHMPGMDGIEFLRALADLGFDGSIVLMSGEDARILKLAEDLGRARRLQVLGAMQKPVRAAHLNAMLQNWQCSSSERNPKGAREVGADDLRRAIESGEITPVFQPQLDVATGEVCSVEALARWNSPTLGPMPPDVFIPLAEKHGLIDILTYRIMTDAFAQARQWARAGLDLRVAVNVSALSLRDLDFPDRVLSLVKEAGLSPTSLTLEVTESRVADDPLAAADALLRLRLQRFRLSIDDFGTGYASLSQLRDLPFSELKVDRTFVRGAANSPTARALLESSIELGRKLEMTVVAEGVELQADWDRIKALGCDMAQGYLICKPMAGSGIAAWVAERRQQDALLRTE